MRYTQGRRASVSVFAHASYAIILICFLVGFKSVFTVADVVRIWSRDYGFMFDKRERLGVMAPIWIGRTLNTAGWTIFSLDLSSTTNRKELVSRLEDIQPSLLLFLRKLHRIKITTPAKVIKIEKTLVDDITRAGIN